MPDIKVTIKNMPQIRAAFRQAPMLTVKELNTAIKQSIFGIAGASATNAPVRTGRLRSSHFTPEATRFRNLYGETGPTVNYAIFVHEGTRYMAKRPFLLKAVQSKQQEVQRFFTQAVQRVLNKIARDSG